MKCGKSAGLDGIPIEFFKSTAMYSIHVLVGLFRNMWSKKEVPHHFVDGIIVPVPKKGDLSSCNNYRGITLLNAISKILCHVLLSRLIKYVAPMLRINQAGFLPERSCADQIFTIRILLQQCNEWCTGATVCFIDYEKCSTAYIVLPFGIL